MDPTPSEKRPSEPAKTSIPWYAQALWILFWIGVFAYLAIYLFPAMKRELFSPM